MIMAVWELLGKHLLLTKTVIRSGRSRSYCSYTLLFVPVSLFPDSKSISVFLWCMYSIYRGACVCANCCRSGAAC